MELPEPSPGPLALMSGIERVYKEAGCLAPRRQPLVAEGNQLQLYTEIPGFEASHLYARRGDGYL
jgi:hypothetical protein